MKVDKKGFLLMDVLVAAAFMGIITVTLFPTVAFLLRRNTATQATVEANLLIQEGIETAYNIFSLNWNAYPAGEYSTALDTTFDPPQYILVSPPTTDLIEARYTRIVTIEDVKRINTDGNEYVDAKSRKIISKVMWKDTNGNDVSNQASLLLYDFK
jgi:type II secretory pathway pseudopilin PulG